MPADADVEDLRREARAEGRYRLDPVDDHNRPIANAQSSYVCVHATERPHESVPPPAVAAVPADTTAALIAALLESQKQHTELARMYVSQFPVIANAMADVVGSAGDVGLTTRVPLVVPGAPLPDGGVKLDIADEHDIDDQDDDVVEDHDDGAIDDALEEGDAGIATAAEYSWPRVAQAFAEYVGPLLAGFQAWAPFWAHRTPRRSPMLRKDQSRMRRKTLRLRRRALGSMHRWQSDFAPFSPS